MVAKTIIDLTADVAREAIQKHLRQDDCKAVNKHLTKDDWTGMLAVPMVWPMDKPVFGPKVFKPNEPRPIYSEIPVSKFASMSAQRVAWIASGGKYEKGQHISHTLFLGYGDQDLQDQKSEQFYQPSARNFNPIFLVSESSVKNKARIGCHGLIDIELERLMPELILLNKEERRALLKTEIDDKLAACRHMHRPQSCSYDFEHWLSARQGLGLGVLPKLP